MMSSPLDRYLSEFDATLPLEQAATIPSSWYTAAEFYEAEAPAVFHDTWQFAARTEQLDQPGRFVTLDIAGEPIVVVRDDSGRLRAFRNVCRHRAARVAISPEGQASRFRCRYHGWTYDLGGRLRGVPEFDGVAGFDREANGLVPVAVDSWGPFVFVHLGAEPTPLGELLSEFPAEMKALNLDRFRFRQRRQYELQCNWKVFVDNYLDGGYHVNTIHPGLASVLDYSGYRTELAQWSSVQVSPLQPSTCGTGSTGEVRTGTSAYYWWLFPNWMVNLYEQAMDTNWVVPEGPHRCRVVFDYYFAEDAAEELADRSIAVGHQIQLEDVAICEDVHRGLCSRAFTAGRYSVRREAGVYHFHQLLAAKLAATAQ